MSIDKHITEARRLYRKALQEFHRAENGKDEALLRDACGKG